jgi:hypothetical protein
MRMNKEDLKKTLAEKKDTMEEVNPWRSKLSTT